MACSTAMEPQISKGSILGGFYKVESFLGEGGFGFVTKCRHIETDTAVAIKVNKNHPRTFLQARQEVAILKQLRCLDPDTCNIVKWNGFFFDRENICLNFELLDQSLYSYMESRGFQCFPMTELRPIIHQVATALYHLSSKGIIHGDLKPDNFMVVDRKEQPLKVKLIDFGLALPVTAVEPGACVQTTWYRAPEVLLGCSFTEAIDMWSLGVTAIDLATGYPIYPGTVNYEMLNFILQTQGQPADHLLDRGLDTKFYFERQNDGQQRWKLKTPSKFAFETGCYPRATRCIKARSLDELEFLMDDGDERGRHQLMDLIKRMLHLDPDQRIKPLEVLQHPFLTDSVPQTSCADNCIQTTDAEEETTEVSQPLSTSQTAGPENTGCRIEINLDILLAGSEDDTGEADVQSETTEVSQPLSTSQTAGPENTDCRIEITPDSLSAGSEDDTGEADDQPETNAEKNGRGLWCFLNRVGRTILSYIPFFR